METERGEPMGMRGFYLSVNQNHEIDCGVEDAYVYLTETESEGIFDVEIASTSERFPDFTYKGIKTVRGDKETLAVSYVIESQGRDPAPGIYYLESRTDSAISEKTIFTGYWSGNAVRPESMPLVTCPYVLVPRDAIGEGGCGGAGEGEMAEGLKKYLGKGPSGGSRGVELGTCYSPITADGKSTPGDISFGNY